MPDLIYDYPFDPDGIAVTNIIPDEHQTLTAVNADEYHTVIPRYAPFYAADLEIRHGSDPDPLIEGVDYLLGYHFNQASINTAQPVYGSIILLNKALTGLLRIYYRTVGGMWTLLTEPYNQLLSDKLVNPRHTTWEQVTGTPQIFPVIEHIHVDDADMTGLADLVNSVDAMTQALIDNMASNLLAGKQQLPIACSDNTTPIVVGNGLVEFRWQYDYTLESVAASLKVPQTSGALFTVDILKNNVSILSTKITIANNGDSSLDAILQPVLSSNTIDKNDKISICVLQIGSGEAAGLIVYMNGAPRVA